MGNSRISLALATLLAVAVVSTEVHGQIVYGRQSSTDIRLVYSSWTMKTDTFETTISQFSVPINGFIPLGEGLEGQLYIDGSSNSLDFGAGKSKATGLGDLRLQISKALSDAHLLVSGGISAPTGEKKLPAADWAVVQQLSTDFLSFPSRQLGAGLGLNALVGGATMLGELRCGAGVSYQYAGKYTPVRDGGEYDPGDQVSVNAGVNGGDIGGMLWSTNAIFTTYADAKYGGAKAFKQGTELQFQVGFQHSKPESYSLSGAIRYVLRGRSTEYADSSGVVDNQLRRFGNEISGNISYSRMVGTNWSVEPALSLRVIGSTETGVNGSNVSGSNVLGISGTVGRRFDKSLIEAGVTYYTGKANGSKTTLNGLQLSSTLHIAL